MEKKKYGVFKRLTALALSLVMVFSMLPVVHTAAAVVENSQQVDPSTMADWMEYFHPTDITTAHAGGVWTDKSVFAQSPFSSNAIKVDQENNFLVALSALGSNSVVIGQNYAPTDTMFVLDVSNSMKNDDDPGALDDMVLATNNAIRALLSGENNTNRVGVVLFGTTASVLLPLDHYEGVEENGVETYIQLIEQSWSGYRIQTARVTQSTGSGSGNWWDNIFGGGSQTETVYLKDSRGQNVDNSASASGGTYVQGGLWAAWNQFDGAADDVETDSETYRRVPVMVLMCDGAATYSAVDYDNVTASQTNGQPGYGSGSNSSTGDGFVTQLTAAYVKEKMKQEYGSAFFYTLGLDVQDIAIAQAILDPANKTEATDIDDAWEDFLKGSATVSMYRRSGGGGYQDMTISNDSDITYTENSYKYVDRYFNASQASDLSEQFQNIVNQISLSAGYYPTHLDDNGSNYSGYITFVDELGSGMEVKEIEGIVLGDKVYTGEVFARALVSNVFGTEGQPTAAGNEFVRAIKARLGLTENEDAWALLNYAWNKGYLSYDQATGKWSNYIVWYGDANGEYLGYEESLASTATYRNACYAMFGEPDGEHQFSDMMYVGIQVSTKLSTGDQTVTFRVPASMLPVVTYQINVHGSAVVNGETATLNYHAAKPIQLVYEVGVREDITEENIREYATQIGNKWYLYTNKWNQNPDLSSTANNNLTYSYFEPGADNEHYYFTENAVIYTNEERTGTLSSADELDVSGTYYYEHYVFRHPVQNADGSFTVKADFHVEKLSETALKAAKDAKLMEDGKLCVPKGTLHYDDNHHSKEKGANNESETFSHVRYQIVGAAGFAQSTAEHYELAYLGNNGRLEVQPATGISITKRVDSTITDPNAAYTFEITFTGVPDGTYNGVAVSGGKATVQLKANETVYLYDLPVGAHYTVVEKYGDGYKQSASVNHDDVVAEDSIIEVIFTNTKRGAGSLSIEKDVTDHPFTTSQIESLAFNFIVELTKEDGTAYSGNVPAIKSGDSAFTGLTFTDGKASFTLCDNQELNLLDLPEGTTYKVYEVDAEGNAVAIGGVARAGFKLVSVAGGTASNIAQGNITENEVKYAHFVNKYVATAISPAIDVGITKTVVGNGAAAENFTFSIEQITPATTWSQIITTGTGTANAVKILNGLSFSGIGTYSFLIHEITPEGSNKTPGMTYDAKRASFTVVVTDNDMDGNLEWAIGDVVNATKSDAAPHITVSFTNIYDKGSATATFHAKKNLINNSGIDIPLTGFHFGLYKDEDCTQLAFVEDPTAAGYDATNPRSQFTAGPAGLVDIKVHITRTMLNGASELVYYLKEIVPAEPVPGMIYDTTVYKVTIPVNDDGTDLTVGQIIVEPVAGNSDVESAAPTTAIFNNKYKVKSTTVELSGNKTLNGRNWKDGETFTFELYDTDATFHFHAGDKPAEAVAQAGTKAFAFEKLTFDKVGIYHYVVAEKNSGLTIDGLTYDHVEYHITVTVTLKEGTDELQAAVTAVKLGNGAVSHTALNFVNVYKAAPAKATLSGIKQVQNNSDSSVVISPKGYSFELRRNNSAGEVLQTVTSDTEGKFSFDELTFTEAGEYVFEVIEVGAGNTVINGVSYNAGNWNVKVVVTDDGMGRLVAEVKPGDKGLTNVDPADKSKGSSVFINTYTAEETKLSLTGYKELIGAEGTNRPLGAEDFSFTLKPVGTAPMPNGAASLIAKNDAQGKITFPEIPFAAVGQYQYTIEEDKEADGTDGIYYDKVIYTVTVDVVDKGNGKLEAKVSHISAKTGNDESSRRVIDFFNDYAASSVHVVISGNKVLENVTSGIAAADKNIPLTGENLTKFPFSFTLEAVTENAPLPAETTVSSGENGAIVFGEIIFEKVGEYKYTVKEVIPAGSNGAVDGVTYTQQTHNITVVVTDDQHGKLKAEVKLEDVTKAEGTENVAAEILSFKNTYKAEPPQDPEDPTAQPGSVVFEGIKKVENLSDPSVAISPAGYQFRLSAGSQALQTVTSDADGKFSFDELVFDTLGEYTFTIEEVPGDKDYITYYSQSITVKVQVTDEDLDGWMEIAVTYNGEASLTVTNTYKADGTKLALTGKKEMDHRDPRENEFTFKLTALGGAPMPGTETSVTVKNDAAGKILFPEITYDTVGQYKYTMEEVREADGTNGVTYDKSVYEITVTVSDVGNGTLVAVAKSVKQGQTTQEDVVFFNKYQAAPAEVDFEGVKTLNGRDLADGEFTFLLTDETGKVLQTVKNKDGKVSFETEKLLAAGTYKFFIKEDASENLKGITYDAKVHEVVIVVKDDGFGQLKAYIGETEVKAVSFGFTNTFTPEDIQAEVTVNKQLQNLCDKPMGLEGFQFQLVDAEGKKTVQASDAEGIAKFLLTFGAEDAGKTFTYKLTEVDTQIKGMSYSTAEFEVKVVVTKDESTGKLSAAVTLAKDGEAQEKAVFVNTYNQEEPPKMGDETNLMGLGLCMGISGISLLAVLVLGKKKFFAE